MSTSDSRRVDFERRQRRRSTTIAATSTFIVLVVLVVLIPKMPRWDRVKASFFDVDQFQSSFPRLLEAFLLDVKIFLWSVPLIFLVALSVALLRNSRSPALFPLRMFTVVFVDVMRGVPVLLWIYLIGFGVPGLGL